MRMRETCNSIWEMDQNLTTKLLAVNTEEKNP